VAKPVQNSAFILAISSVAALGGLLFGFDTAVISGAIPSLQVLFDWTNTRWGGRLAQFWSAALWGRS